MITQEIDNGGRLFHILQVLTDAFTQHLKSARNGDASLHSVSPARVTVRVLLNFGDVAELVTPEHGPDEPLRMPAAHIVRDAGLPTNELPGRRFTAVRAGDGYADFRLIDDPRT